MDSGNALRDARWSGLEGARGGVGPAHITHGRGRFWMTPSGEFLGTTHTPSRSGASLYRFGCAEATAQRAFLLSEQASPSHRRGVSSRGAGHAPSLADPTSSRFRHGHFVEGGGESVTGGESS